MTQTAEQRVKEKHPKAMCYKARHGLDGVSIFIPPINSEFDICMGKMLSGVCANDEEAWKDAAKRLEDTQ